MGRRTLAGLLLLAAATLLTGAGAVSGAETLRLATTTSTENSGLLGYLLPVFRERSGIHVQVIASPSGSLLPVEEKETVSPGLAKT